MHFIAPPPPQIYQLLGIKGEMKISPMGHKCIYIRSCGPCGGGGGLCIVTPHLLYLEDYLMDCQNLLINVNNQSLCPYPSIDMLACPIRSFCMEPFTVATGQSFIENYSQTNLQETKYTIEHTLTVLSASDQPILPLKSPKSHQQGCCVTFILCTAQLTQYVVVKEA